MSSLPYDGDKKPASNQPPPTSPLHFPHTFGCLHLARSDRVRLVGLPGTVYNEVENAINRSWPAGIQEKIEDFKSMEWKLRGRPWRGQGVEAVWARRLMSHLICALCIRGWELYASVDLSKKPDDKDTLIFRSGPPRQRVFFSISFNQGDKVRIIDPPSEMVKTAFMTAVQTWYLGIQSETEKEPGCHQVKLRGMPWYTSKKDEVTEARLLSCTLLSAMGNCGYELIGSVDMSSAYTGGGDSSSSTGDLDTWFFASVVN